MDSTLSQAAYDFQSYLVSPNLTPSDHTASPHNDTETPVLGAQD